MPSAVNHVFRLPPQILAQLEHEEYLAQLQAEADQQNDGADRSDMGSADLPRDVPRETREVLQRIERLIEESSLSSEVKIELRVLFTFLVYEYFREAVTIRECQASEISDALEVFFDEIHRLSPQSARVILNQLLSRRRKVEANAEMAIGALNNLLHLSDTAYPLVQLARNQFLQVRGGCWEGVVRPLMQNVRVLIRELQDELQVSDSMLERIANGRVFVSLNTYAKARALVAMRHLLNLLSQPREGYDRWARLTNTWDPSKIIEHVMSFPNFGADEILLELAEVWASFLPQVIAEYEHGEVELDPDAND